MPAERRTLHQNVAGALEIPDEPPCDDVGHECVRVVLALPALEFQREGERCGKFVGISGRELFVGGADVRTHSERTQGALSLRGPCRKPVLEAAS